MTTICSCGHEALNDEIVYCAVAGFDKLNQQCVYYEALCTPCHAQYKLENYILNNEEEEREWLMGGDANNGGAYE